MPAVETFTTGYAEIQYWEDPRGWKESHVPGNPEYVRRLKCRWSEKDDFVLAMVGFTAGIGTDGKLARHIPNEHPAFAGAYAVSCNFAEYIGVAVQDEEGALAVDLADSDGTPPAPGTGEGTGFAVYDVTYKRFNFDVAEDADIASELERYVFRRRKGGIETMTIPGQAYRFADALDAGLPDKLPDGVTDAPAPTTAAGSPILGDRAKMLPMGSVVYELFMVPEEMIDYQKFSEMEGTVNSGVFDEGFGDYPAETLLLQPVEYEPVQHATASFYYTIRFTWLRRPLGWNKLFNGKEGVFLKIVDNATGATGPYTALDHNELFEF